MNIDFTPEQLVAFYRSSSNKGRKAVKEALGEKFSEAIPAIERVKTYEDAVKELGEDHPLVVAANSADWRFPEAENKDIVAYIKLRVVVAALNDGWQPEFTENERRWYPWFELKTKEEIEEMSDSEKEALVLWGGYASYGSLAGLAFALSPYAFSLSHSSFGARLAFKTEELAEYAGKQFINLYANLYFTPKSDDKK